ncbi:MAG TPA: zf-HC2 domain-containing protein [Thermodesulfovibrionales bacterium]|nr:zf-HC2 domain-containing protein [Thermodesulfovibrionales bacterium]
MECISDDVIENLFDSDLSDQEREIIFSHLAECDMCAERAMAIAVSEKALIEKLTNLRTHSHDSIKQTEGCLSKKLILGYVIGELPQLEMRSVDAHLESCDACLKEMMSIQSRYINDVELGFDTQVLTASMRAGNLTPEQKSPVSEGRNLIISLLEDVTRHIIEVIQTTGTVLKSPIPLEASRGTGRSTTTGTVHIRKDFIDYDMSAEVTVKKGNKPGTYTMKLSLMKLLGNEITGALESITVRIRGGNVDKEVITDNSGEVVFSNLPMGGYKIVLENGIEVTINIQKT